MLTDAVLGFIRQNPTAAMITTRKGGSSHVARCTAVVVDGAIVSSGTQSRVRTKHVRQNPQATLFVFGQGAQWLGIEATIIIHEGEEGYLKELALKTALDGHPPADPDAYIASRRKQQRLVYEFVPVRIYGSYQ